MKRIFAMCLAALLLAAPTVCRAAASDTGIDAGFSVSAVIPDNQIDPDAGYFHLQMEPGQVQELAVSIANPGDQPIVVTVEAVTASTNRNGIILYSAPGIYDETMPHSFGELAEVKEETVTIPPRSERRAVVRVTMPQEEWEGLLLGAIRVVRQPPGEDIGGIVNQFSYAIGVRLVGAEWKGTEEFALGTVQAELINYKAAVVTQIRNPQPLLVRDLSARTQIFQEGEDTPILEKSQEDVDMAPHSVFPMTLMDREGYGLPEGDYVAVVSLAHGDRTWEFRQDFTIEKSQADYINGAAVNQNPPVGKAGYLWVWIAPVTALGGAATALFLSLRKRYGCHRKGEEAA